MTRFAAAVCLAVATLTLAACGSSSSSGGGGGAGGPVVIGTSISKTGPLGVFAPLILAGYNQAIQDVNSAGGLDVAGKKRKVRLVVLDNASDPNQATQQVRQLVDQNSAVALLGGATPPINQPEAGVAESLRVPFLSSIQPVNPWIAAGRQWHYGFEFGFDNQNAIKDEYKALNLVKTNKKVALFTDNEVDGQQWAKTDPQLAASAGYKVVSRAVFPVGTTDFKSFVQQAKQAGAGIVITQMIPPDGIALWKQMKALNFKPQIAFCEKCGATGAFVGALGPVANGTLTAGFWTSSANLPDTAHIKATLGQTLKTDPDLAIAVWSYTAGKVLMDAITKAGSTDAAKVRTALAATNGSYPIGHVQFTNNNSSTIPSYQVQWQGPQAVQVYPPVAGAKLQFPSTGLQ